MKIFGNDGYGTPYPNTPSRGVTRVNGMHAIAAALQDCGAKMVTGVPGYPITELMEALRNPVFKYGGWSVNEKVALDIALGSSICGQRSAVITKHVGMNVLADSLVSSTTHTIGAGVVIIAGDDPGAQKSQNEQDSRFYGLIAEVPVFDPSNPEVAYRCIKEAFLLSEKVSAPVVVRITDRLLKSNGKITRKKEPLTVQRFDKNIWHLTMRGKHQRFHRDSMPEMHKYAEKSRLNSCKKRGSVGIISSGFPASLVKGNVSHLYLGMVNPLPLGLINRFMEEHERVLVVEETEPFIERQLSGRVLGKLTGHLPYGIVEARDIKKAVENIDKDIVSGKITTQAIKERGSHPLCEDCPYLPLYAAIKELNVPVAGDLGCSILTSAPPLLLLNAAFSLGSSIATACGFSRKGIAIVGDFGLAHSGIAGLINAVHNKHGLVVIVLQNEVAAMTGGQEAPDLTGMIKSCVRDTAIIDPQDVNLKSVLEKKLKKKGISVLLARAACPRY